MVAGPSRQRRQTAVQSCPEKTVQSAVGRASARGLVSGTSCVDLEKLSAKWCGNGASCARDAKTVRVLPAFMLSEAMPALQGGGVALLTAMYALASFVLTADSYSWQKYDGQEYSEREGKEYQEYKGQEYAE